MYMCMCAYVYIYIYIYLFRDISYYMYIYIYREREISGKALPLRVDGLSAFAAVLAALNVRFPKVEQMSEYTFLE